MLNLERNPKSLVWPNDGGNRVWYSHAMAKARIPRPTPRHDWFLREWLGAKSKIQADLEKELEWNKSKASLMIHCTQKYTRDEVNQVADWLHIEPYELLMHPRDANALRQLRATALSIAANSASAAAETDATAIPAHVRTGTEG